MDTYPHVVHFEHDTSKFWSVIALAVFSMALLISNDRFGWPDDETVIDINNAMLHNVEMPELTDD